MVQDILFWKFMKLFIQVFGLSIQIPKYYSRSKKNPSTKYEYYYLVQLFLYYLNAKLSVTPCLTLRITLKNSTFYLISLNFTLHTTHVTFVLNTTHCTSALYNTEYTSTLADTFIPLKCRSVPYYTSWPSLLNTRELEAAD